MKYFRFALTLTSAASTAFFAPVSGECDTQEADIVTELDLFDSEVVTNTLHLPEGELRYNNVGTFKDQKLDLRVTVTGGDYTDIAGVWADRGKDPNEQNGKGGDGMFGNINLQTVENKPKSGEGDFTFCIVKENTNEPVTLKQFAWTIFDLDERGADTGNNGIGIKEKFLMDVSQAEFFQVIEGTEVKISCEDGSDVLPCDPGIRTVFKSSTAGTGKDNPTDPSDLSFVQQSRSVAFVFKDTSCWDITYDHYCPVDQPEYTGTETKCRGKYTGGNFLFSGSAGQIVDDGECMAASTPTISPTGGPTTTEPTTAAPTTGEPTTIEPTTAVPTTAPPTGSPTSLTTTFAPTTHSTSTPTTGTAAVPTSSPTTGSPTRPPLPPPDCPEDVELIKINGVTEVDLGQAVRIVRQAEDKSTVTVRLNQVWTSRKVDHIFYQYDSGPYKSDCTEQTDVPGGAVYTPDDDITITCMETKPIAELGICVADAGDGFLDRTLDGATVPKCCHPDFDPAITPVVCYKVLVRCESRCIDAVARRGLLRGAGKFLE